MKILFLSRWFPFPADNGSKLRIFNLLKITARCHQVDLVSFASEAVSDRRIEGLKPYCGKVRTIVFRDFNPRSLRSILGFFSWKPRFIIDTYQKEFTEIVRQFALQENYDLVVASEVDMIPYLNEVPGAKKLLEEIEVAKYIDSNGNGSNAVQRFRSQLTWWKHKRYLSQALRNVDGFTVVSERELDLVNHLGGSGCRGELIPNGIDIDQYQDNWGEPEPNTLVYAGALTYDANLDAMRYFISEILPIIKEKKPLVKLFITGKVNEQIKASLPFDPNVEFTGYLEDVRPRIARSWISIIPLRIGGGTRLKLLESLALGTPVISTSKGAEGLELTPGKDLIIRDLPHEFAIEVVNILESKEARDNFGFNGKSTVGSMYSWRIIGERFLKFIDDIVDNRKKVV